MELMVSMTLMFTALVAILTVFESVQRTAAFTQARAESADEMRIAMDRMTKEARQATAISATSTGSRLDMQTYVNGTSTHIIYAVTGVTLTRTVGASTAEVLHDLNSTSVFAFTPSVSGAQLITITLTVKPKRRPDTILDLTSEVRLRNQPAP